MKLYVAFINLHNVTQYKYIKHYDDVAFKIHIYGSRWRIGFIHLRVIDVFPKMSRSMF